MGDRELLAIKLALEEWRHWLEVPNIACWFGWIIRIWLTSNLLSDSTPVSHADPCSSLGSISPFPSVLVPVILSPMPSHVFTPQMNLARFLSPFFPLAVQ